MSGLSQEEIDEIWRSYVEDRDPETLEFLVAHYESLARYLARRALAKAPPYQDAEDILSYAHHGLLDAIARFEPGRVKFETYATRRIAGSIIDGQRRQDPLGRAARKGVKALAATEDALWNKLGREPTVSELAQELGEAEDQIRELLLTRQTLMSSLSELFADSGEPVRDEITTGLIEQSPAEVEAFLRDITAAIAERLPRLSEKERAFVLLYYCERRNLRQVAGILGVSRPRCGQIRLDILESLATSDWTERRHEEMAVKLVTTCDFPIRKRPCDEPAPVKAELKIGKTLYEARYCEEHQGEADRLLAKMGFAPVAGRVDYKNRKAMRTASGRSFTSAEARTWLVEQGAIESGSTGRIAKRYLELYAQAH